MNHLLKCDPAPLLALAANAKRAEVRKLDREYAVGDMLSVTSPLLRENTKVPVIRRIITHIQTGTEYGIVEGYGVLSVRPLTNAEKEQLKGVVA